MSATKTIAAVVAGALCVAAGVDISTRPPPEESMLTMDPGLGSPRRPSDGFVSTHATSFRLSEDAERLRWHVLDPTRGRIAAFAITRRGEAVVFAVPGKQDGRIMALTIKEACSKRPRRTWATSIPTKPLDAAYAFDMTAPKGPWVAQGVAEACRLRRDAATDAQMASVEQAQRWATLTAGGEAGPLDEGRMAASLVLDGPKGMEEVDGGSGPKAQSAKNEENR